MNSLMRCGKLNANQIKLIAIIAMTIDHLTWAFFRELRLYGMFWLSISSAG